MKTAARPEPAGDADPMPVISATDLKNDTADVLDRVIATGGVVITRHDKKKAVMLSIEAYRRLVQSGRDDIDLLRAKFGGLLEKMQSPAARRGAREAFDATPLEMGKEAVKAARRRG